MIDRAYCIYPPISVVLLCTEGDRGISVRLVGRNIGSCPQHARNADDGQGDDDKHVV